MRLWFTISWPMFVFLIWFVCDSFVSGLCYIWTAIVCFSMCMLSMFAHQTVSVFPGRPSSGSATLQPSPATSWTTRTSPWQPPCRDSLLAWKPSVMHSDTCGDNLASGGEKGRVNKNSGQQSFTGHQNEFIDGYPDWWWLLWWPPPSPVKTELRGCSHTKPQCLLQ